MRAPRAPLLIGGLVAGLLVGGWAVADTARGKSAGKAVAERYGEPSSLESLAFEPLSSDKKMQAMDGTEFDAKLECPAQAEFMRVSFAPSGANDLQFVAVELDRDLDGTREYSTVIPGPIAAVCTNGAVVCDAGTTTNCRGRLWKASSGALVADEVPRDQLGGCYCFNNSCGAGLLGVNSKQVLGDLGTGIATALQSEFPRLSVGTATQLDATTMQFYGQASGCAADSRPEQYFSNPEQIRDAGVAAGSDPGTLYSRLATSNVGNEKQVTEQRCDIRRVIELRSSFDVNQIVAFKGGSHVASSSCGPRCYDITVGRPGDNYLSAGCGNYVDEASWTILKPELIESAVLTDLSYDDYFSVVFDNSRIVWSDPTGTDGLTRNCGENGGRGPKSPNVDVTSYLRGKAPGSTWTWRNSTWWNDKGEAWAVLRLQLAEDCELDREFVDDGCAALDANLSCTWRDETVDGVNTYSNYFSTGLSPLPSAQDITRGSCRKSFTRDFWTRSRTYTCEGSARQFDASFSTERYDVVSSSFDPATGHFEDLRTAPDGTQTRHSMTAPLPPPQDRQCQRMCKTRKPRPGQAMGEAGSTGLLNPSTPAWDYSYRDCDASDVCPLGADDELVSACNCDSNFFEAVSVMQTIRMTAQDMQCNAP